MSETNDLNYDELTDKLFSIKGNYIIFYKIYLNIDVLILKTHCKYLTIFECLNIYDIFDIMYISNYINISSYNNFVNILFN